MAISKEIKMSTANKFREIFVKKNRYFPVVAYTTEVKESDKYIEIAAVEQLKADLRMSDLNRQSLWADSLKLVDENAALKSKLKIAVEALEFYSSGDNWNHINPGTHYVTNVYPCVDKTDYGEGDFLISERMNVDDAGVGGKKARQALSEIGGEI